MFRIVGWSLLSLILLIGIISIFISGPIIRNEDLVIREASSLIKDYHDIKQGFSKNQGAVRSAWSRQNIMPDFITPMAGYTPRPAYEVVHDSLYVHCIILEVGETTVALLSYDLLIVPPVIASRINQLKSDWGVDLAYFSASHTHSGIGGWDASIGGQVLAGKFDERIVNQIIDATEASIKKAASDLQVSRITYFTSDAKNLVRNRLGDSYKVDGRVSSFEISREDGSIGLFTSFSAHATNVAPKARMISNDYPGALVRQLETGKYDFAMFMSGTVGSHSVNASASVGDDDPAFLDEYAALLAEAMESKENTAQIGNSVGIRVGTFPLSISPPQLRISDNLRLRQGVFETFFAPLQVEVTYLEIGDMLMLGMPCDFSGEIVVENDLYQFAENHGKKLIITSFNGGYLGYITSDHHYETTRRGEIREMNWVGPYHGEFFTKMVKEIVE